mmetsp:Transcript_30041/g.70003  ORF Transcript_30041/g.70003 Transcript_30041/m.70003 type:complete len:567 (-) Transcript_30041:118-1818(-)
MTTRCDIIVIAWTAFVGLDLVFNAGRALWGDETERQGTNPVRPDLYRGDYRLIVNGSVQEEGMLHMTFTSWQTSAVSLDVAVLQMSLVKHGSWEQDWSLLQANQVFSREQDFVFAGLSFDGRGSFSATGFSNPEHFTSFGPRRCSLLGLLNFQTAQAAQGASPQAPGGIVATITTTSQPPRRLVPGIPEALHSGNGSRAVVQPDGVLQGSGRDWASGAQALSDLAMEDSGMLAGEVMAGDCGFVVSFRVNPIQRMMLSHKLVRYSLWAIMLTLLEVRCFHAQMLHAEDAAGVAKVSAICIAMQAMMDAYSSFVHFFLGLSSGEMFNIIAVVALLKFVQFSLLEARYLLQIWRSRRQDELTVSQELETSLRWQIMWFYSGFYAVLVGGMLLVRRHLSFVPYIVVASQFYWLPQILVDIWQGTKQALSPVFYMGTAVLRTLAVLYIFGCPKGIFTKDLYPLPGTPNLAVCAAVVIIQALQVATLMSQERFGPRWFVPWLCMPFAHNYKRRMGLEAGAECVICMSEIDDEDGRYANTPCNHRFHFECLQQWLDVKMECPTCRATLPPIL